ncbi:hypothetical protein ESCO_000990 [Escovopsis weberi]|uniref:Uncharacterized protein n=1 Tax=Escovopsis weberi TaxID=150374 RepID=A0A0M8N3A4_ESCWE|nr:hypothetical protein ESCO_000990 [Escovopsis weberi]
MPIRNPFSRRAAVTVLTDENMPPSETAETGTLGFERVDTIGSKASSILNIRAPRTIDTGEYKMSVVNDSGVYLPPSPTEDKGLWRPRHLSSRASTQSRSSSGDMEQFSISRESFDSYRRSFDIMARSPISVQDSSVRQSLDSANSNYHLSSKSAIDRSVDRELPPPEELFEDIGLDDQKAVPRKRGFFSKFTDSQDKDSGKDAGSPQTNVARFLIPGRKRGQLSQESELGRIGQTTKTTNSDE